MLEGQNKKEADICIIGMDWKSFLPPQFVTVLENRTMQIN